MQIEKNIPDYLTDDFSMYLENMSSLSDPENPELLSTYLTNLFAQLKTSPLLFSGMVDQLAMAITTKVRVDGKNLAALDLSYEPSWSSIKPFVSVHGDARESISQIMTHAEQDLKMAILVIHFYSIYDATPITDDATEQEDEGDDLSEEFDENY